jgi:hypothetical protein
MWLVVSTLLTRNWTNHTAKSLKPLLHTAETRLTPGDRTKLADLIAAFIATHEDHTDFTPEDRAHLDLPDRDPFIAADPAEIAALFSRRGQPRRPGRAPALRPRMAG